MVQGRLFIFAQTLSQPCVSTHYCTRVPHTIHSESKYEDELPLLGRSELLAAIY